MINLNLQSNRSFLACRLAFWRLMASLAEYAIQYKPQIQPLLPFIPVLGAGTLAYLIGLGVGGILKTLMG
jgi:hypothetical protein